jgi:hypothetical protein
MRNWLKNKGKSTYQYIAHMLKGRVIANTQIYRASHLNIQFVSLKLAGKTKQFSVVHADLRLYSNFCNTSCNYFEKFKEAPYGYIN